jgi:hypothetical protein
VNHCFSPFQGFLKLLKSGFIFHAFLIMKKTGKICFSKAKNNRFSCIFLAGGANIGLKS